MSLIFDEPRQFSVKRTVIVSARGRSRVDGRVVTVSAEGPEEDEQQLRQSVVGVVGLFGQGGLDAIDEHEVEMSPERAPAEAEPRAAKEPQVEAPAAGGKPEAEKGNRREMQAAETPLGQAPESLPEIKGEKKRSSQE